MPEFWVSSPYINLRVEDVPLWWNPGAGRAVQFHLSYRQRGFSQELTNVFGVGTNWSCSFRAYTLSMGGTPEWVQVHKGGAGWIAYTNGVTQYLDGSILTNISGGYQIQYADGATDTFTNSFNDGGSIYYFLSSQSDPQGNTTIFNYSSQANIVQLTNITDADGHTAYLYYQNPTYPNQITMVVDPFSRTNFLAYDNNGFLTNIVDVQKLTNSFAYDPVNIGFLTSMTTPYGTTTFSYGGTNVTSTDFSTDVTNNINRWLLATLPNGGNHLYLYQQDCSAFMSSTYSSMPTVTAFNATAMLDNVDQQNRNSFHWDPYQYANLSTTVLTNLTSSDYLLGHLYHWLSNSTSVDPSDTLSLERLPSPDKTTRGQITWYDYFGKAEGADTIGTNMSPSIVAVVLPDGTTRYSHYTRNQMNAVTQLVSTYSSTNGFGLRTNTFYYNSNGIDLSHEVGPNNEQVISNYFAGGNAFHEPNASYDALNQQTLYTYNGAGQITSRTPPNLLTRSNVYFTGGASVNRLQYHYDFNGSQIFRTNAFSYTADLDQTVTDERGVIVTNFWDNLHRLTGVGYPDGTSISNIYTFLDRTAAKDRLSNWTHFGYDSVRNKIAETNANNVVTRYGYCECGALMEVTNAWNTPVQFVTSYDYDYQENSTYVVLPDFTITNYFNSMRQLTRRDAETGSRSFYYNNQGLLTNMSNAYGTERAAVFDNEDRPTIVTDANGVTVTNTYDFLGRLLTREYPDGGQERFGYSAMGLVAYTNQIGKTNYFAYDAGTRKVFETNADDQLIQYYHDATGNLTNLVDGKGQSTKWNFDQFSRLTNKLDQAGSVVLQFVYDADNRLFSRWSAAKGTTYYTNDAIGNLTYIHYPSSHSITFQYDALNRVTSMVDGAGTTTYSYAAGGELATEDGPYTSDTLTNTYVNRLRSALSLQQPTGSWTNGFIYDAAGRLTNVTSEAGRFAYTLGGSGPSSALVKKLLLPNTSYITNNYDSVARLTGTFLDNNIATVLDSTTYGYNLASQRAASTNAGTFFEYSYDPIGQLTIATCSASIDTRGYGYDTAWNLQYITNAVGGVGTYELDTKNELTNGNATTFTWDANGNLSSANNSGGNQMYIYDDENRLVNVSLAGSYNTSFLYDGLGRLRKRSENSSGTTNEYIYDGMRVIQERDANNTPTVSYTRGPDLSTTLEGAGGIGGLLARSSGYSSGNWTTNYFYHADGNGNITYLVDSSQALAASYLYGAFGNTLSSSGPIASANVYRFSSKEIHVNSGMYIYTYRFYNPNLQRWINRDPLGEESGLNLYAFVGNRPINAADPLGLEGYLGPNGYGPDLQTSPAGLVALGITMGLGTGVLLMVAVPEAVAALNEIAAETAFNAAAQAYEAQMAATAAAEASLATAERTLDFMNEYSSGYESAEAAVQEAQRALDLAQQRQQALLNAMNNAAATLNCMKQ